jgi:hypothetical protein
MNKKIKVLVFGLTVLLSLNLISCKTKTEDIKETVAIGDSDSSGLTYPLVDTNQGLCFDNSQQIEAPEKGEAFYGQDAQYTGNVPSYTDNGDGTVTDNVTGLIWTQELSDYSMLWSDAEAYAQSLTTGGITDWRVPTVKELWSIRDFSQGWPWLDTDYFHLVGDGSQGAQQHSWSSNYYLVDTDEAKKNIAFVVNDWTGHIKAMDGKRFVRCVSGKEYGTNNFQDNNDRTVTDEATGLMWAQDDSGEAMNWEEALSYAENSEYAGYDDWRLPNVKELQSIVDYSGVFPSIDTSVFNITKIVNEAGNDDFPYFWTSTSNPYIDPNDEDGYWYAWYVAFGYAVGTDGQDLHGSGAVRFDTKHVDGADGPDGERYYNYVRLVRGGDVIETPEGDPSTVKADRVVSFPDGDTGGIVSGERGPASADSKDAKQGHPDGPTSENMQGAPGPNSQQPGPDFDAIAKKLGISVDALMTAFGDPVPGCQPDFAAIAKKLGITLDQLIEAMGTMDGPPGPNMN